MLIRNASVLFIHPNIVEKLVMGLMIAVTMAAVHTVGARSPNMMNAILRKRIQGDLLYLTLDDTEQWLIRDSRGNLVLLSGGYQPPDKDPSGAPVTPGSVVQLDCFFNATADDCTPDNSTALTVITLASAASSDTRTVIYQDLLVMIFHYPNCNYPASLSETEVRTLYLGPNQDGNGGFTQRFSQCSYGKFGINATTFRAVRVEVSQCYASITGDCTPNAIQQLVDRATSALIGQEEFSSFSHYTYILPPGLRKRCSWEGLATVGSSMTWLQTSADGVYNWATVLQESLHNYGLWHSWQNGREYGDNSSAMGRGNACPNAAEISRMGWATPAVGGDQLNSSTLEWGIARTFTLPATYLTGNNSYLRVTPDWLPAYNVHSAAKNLYMAVRVAKNGDAGLGEPYTSKVNIHEVNATIDNGYLTPQFRNTDRKIQFINAVSPMSQLILDDFKLIVSGGSWVGRDTLRVHVCRFLNSADECPSLRSLEPSTPPPPSPAPPIPLPPSPPPPPSPTPPIPLPPSPRPRMPAVPPVTPPPNPPNAPPPRPQPPPKPQPPTSLQPPTSPQPPTSLQPQNSQPIPAFDAAAVQRMLMAVLVLAIVVLLLMLGHITRHCAIYPRPQKEVHSTTLHHNDLYRGDQIQILRHSATSLRQQWRRVGSKVLQGIVESEFTNKQSN